MRRLVKIGNRNIGDGEPVYIAAEIGINHNGDIEIAKKLIDVAAWAGCDAVKFQKRTPELCVPPEQRGVMRETPWGYISYLDYRYRVEFGFEHYREIDRYCREKKIDWFASCWDEMSVDFIEQFDPPAHKICSAALTDDSLLKRLRQTGKPLILSTGMSTIEQIRAAIKTLGNEDLIVAHSTSTYPCPPEELNLKMITSLRQEFLCPIGYSGHEVGLATTVVTVGLGACYLERHITLDRAMWGSDQAASVEPGGLERLVKYVRVLERSMGDGIKHVYPSEVQALSKLRRVQATASVAVH